MEAALQTLTGGVQQMLGTSDELLRRKTINKLRDLQFALETPEDTLQRTAFLVGIDMKLYELLATSQAEGKPALSYEDVAKKLGVETTLAKRLLRHQASVGYIKEVEKDTYTANNITKNLAHPNIAASMRFTWEAISPVSQAWPQYLMKNSYRPVEDADHCAFQSGHKTDLSTFGWLSQRPDLSEDFAKYMLAMRSSTATIFDSYPFAEECSDWKGETLFVDIGGADGEQCRKFSKAFPDLKGDVVLQDLPHMIELADTGDAIKKQAYDFNTPQPIRGAKYYYLRAVCHDWNDEQVISILGNQRDAMGPQSVILLDEMVIANTQPDWWYTQVDLAMLQVTVGAERSEDEWRALAARCGLRVQRILTYTKASRLSGIVCVKA